MVINKYLAEFMGTFILVFVGSLAILANVLSQGPILAIAFGFGLALLAGIWAVGHISGAHFNPAVTLAMLLDKRTSFGDAIGYWIAQFAGASVASLVIWAASTRLEVAATTTGYRELSTGILVELALTAIFVWVILAVTRTGGNHAPIAIALTLVTVHVAGIPFSGASVNPARSFGPAIVSGAPEAMEQLWVYIVFPLVGAIVAFALYRLFPAAEGRVVEATDTIEATEV
ncbi:MAG TPA: aquaporin [Acidimicrobiia bacterium]|nr:aquaporin [Acidimicrobiia bacterium]